MIWNIFTDIDTEQNCKEEEHIGLNTPEQQRAENYSMGAQAECVSVANT